MNLRKAIKFALVPLMAFALNANAGFVSLDWKVEGDNKATLDEDTGLEWLKLSETDNLSVNNVKNLLESTYAGWRLPTEFEVNQLLGNVLPTFPFVDGDTGYSSSAYQSYASTWRSVMGTGRTYSTSAINQYYDHYYSWGLYEASDSTIQLTGAYLRRYRTNNKTYWLGNIYDGYEHVNYNPDYASANFSVFLVGDGGATLTTQNDLSLTQNNPNSPYNATTDVPEPAGILLLASGLFGLAMVKRKRKIQ